MVILSVLVAAVLVGLGLIHFNWVIGGTFGFEQSLPTNESGERVLNPKRTDSAVVGCGLAVFGLFYLLRSGLLTLPLPDWVMTFGGWAIPTIFLLRAIGEFRYVGFFKKVKGTEFAKWDTNLFSPLCVFIGASGMVVQLVG